MRRWLAAATLVVLAACGGDQPEDQIELDDDEREITDDEAARLAETLVTNRELGGADFQITSRLPNGDTATLEGEVDWADLSGRGTVTTSAGPAAVAEVVWTETDVYERIPDLTDLAAQVGDDIDWVSRRPDPDGRDIDAMIEVLLGLSAQDVDNAVLIQQEPGTAHLRTDEVASQGVAVDVFRYGTGTILWLEQDGTTMWRFESLSNDRPLVADLFAHGERTIEIPDAVPAESVAELYDAAVGLDP
ncbi:hypothetical protein BDK89_2065 [Ilumatobacter fluminis]|uniref:Lipoprotein n=1 Tax=Ilumatobacter fluminis TaxID=467091 RepID=A0A4R7HZD2_9ACTN|nr:hypothetical protein [Ilumatobacter fluminis]TDT16475.1 hypothetical protein BDK89_2065 [Ilumatobacter fluminis]